jgi:hypothetical protein
MPEVLAWHRNIVVESVRLDLCMFGAATLKPFRVAGNIVGSFVLGRRCCHVQPHGVAPFAGAHLDLGAFFEALGGVLVDSYVELRGGC